MVTLPFNEIRGRATNLEQNIKHTKNINDKGKILFIKSLLRIGIK